MADAAAPRNAATIVVLRDAADGCELLMLRRHARSGFAADMWVFPGGVVDRGDVLPSERWRGIDPHALSGRFGIDGEAVLAHYVAAARETFEEAGLLLATTAGGAPPAIPDAELLRTRHALADRNTTLEFGEWLARHDLVLDLGTMTYLSHWVTPAIEPRRYDTRFFLARVPRDQVAGYDRLETTDQRWVTPADALAASKAGEMPMIYPTIQTLRWLRNHPTADDAFAAAAAQETIRRVQPHAELDEHGNFVRILHPDDPAYPRHLYEESA